MCQPQNCTDDCNFHHHQYSRRYSNDDDPNYDANNKNDVSDVNNSIRKTFKNKT